MAQVVPAVCRFELKYRTLDTTMENVFYARTSDAIWSETSIDDVSEAIQTWETDHAQPIRASGYGLYEIVATDLTSLFGIRKAYSFVPIVGALADPMPANVCIAVKADIGRRGRGTAGRTFWLGLAQSQMESVDSIGTISGGLIVSALNALKDAVAGITPIEGLCVPHFVVGGVRPPSVQADIVVQYILSDFTTDSMRDRLPNHKKHKRPPVA